MSDHHHDPTVNLLLANEKLRAERDAYREAVDAYESLWHETAFATVVKVARVERACAALRALGWVPESER